MHKPKTERLFQTGQDTKLDHKVYACKKNAETQNCTIISNRSGYNTIKY